jgi:tetratricopeptide (TPR) repeat protein
MKETKRVSRLLLERYRLDDVSEEQRKLVEAELAADEELRHYYESLEASDSEINRLYPFENFLALTAFRDNAVPADKPRPPKMKETKSFSRLMLERYRLDDVSDEQRKLVEAELAADEGLRHYYESLEASDNEINRLYPYKNHHALAAFRDNAVPAAKGRPVRTRASRLREWRPARLAAAVAVVIIFLTAFYLFRLLNANLASEDTIQATGLNTNSRAESYLNSGDEYYGKGEYDLAIKDYTRAINLNKNYGRAYGNRGNAYSAKGEYDLAIEDYNQAISLNTMDADLFNRRGEAYTYKGEFDLAIEDFISAIFLESNDAVLYYNRSTAYSNKGENDLASDVYIREVTLDDGSIMIFEMRKLPGQMLNQE